MSRFNKLGIWDLLILILIIGVLISNYIWLKLDEYPVEGHELMGVIPAVQAYRELMGMENTYKLYDRILGKYNFKFAYPPLSYLIVILFYLLFGLQGQMVVMVNSIYIIVTLTCVYLIGRHIFNKRIGLLSAFILSSFPGSIAFSRVYWLDFGTMAYVSLALYFLLRTNLFESRRYSILLGISLGLSLLHKYEFITFIIGPFLLVTYRSEALKDIFKMRWTRAMTNIILVLVLSLSLSSFWWVRYGKDIVQRILSAGIHEDQLSGAPYLQIISYTSLTYYFYTIILLIGRVFIILFLLSIFFIMIKIIVNEINRFAIAFLIFSFMAPFISLTLSGFKMMLHILPILPSVALLSGAGLSILKKSIFKKALISLLIMYCLNLHLYTFYSIKDIHSPYLTQILNALNRFTLEFKSNHPAAHNTVPLFLPRKERYEFTIKEILKYIRAESNGRGHLNAFVVFKREAFKNCIFEYYNLIGDYRIDFFSPYRPPFKKIAQYDYVIVEKGEGESIEEVLSKEPYPPDRERLNFKIIFKDTLKDFDLVKIFLIPNSNTSTYIYKRRNG